MLKKKNTLKILANGSLYVSYKNIDLKFLDQFVFKDKDLTNHFLYINKRSRMLKESELFNYRKKFF